MVIEKKTLQSFHKITVVIPAYNEASTIKKVVEEVHRYSDQVVVVDDGSTDSTGERAFGSGALVLRHVINRGQGAALATGTDYAIKNGADIIVHFDGDGQHDVKDIPKLIKPVIDGKFDVALGSRFLGEAFDMPLDRRIILKLGIIFTWLFSGLRLTDTNNGLRAMSSRAAARIRITQDGMAHASEILDELYRQKLRYVEVPVTIHYTDKSLSRGQGSMNAAHIARRLIIDKFFPH